MKLRIERPRPHYGVGKATGSWRALCAAMLHDPEYLALSTDAKLVLLTIRAGTHHTGLQPCNAVELEERVLEGTGTRETRLSRARARRAIRELVAKQHIVQEGRLLWVVDELAFYKHGSAKHAEHREAVAKYMALIPFSEIIFDAFAARYPEWVDDATSDPTSDPTSGGKTKERRQKPEDTLAPAADAAGVRDDGMMEYITREAA